MKANELMIGNFLRYKQDFPDTHLRGKIAKVCGIRGRVDVRTIDDGKFHESEHPDWLEPIPLTPEILEKNGFVFDGTKDWLYKNEHVFFSIRVTPPQPDNEWWDEGATGFEIWDNDSDIIIEGRKQIFVHELQHALRLCGIEKEVEL